MYLSNYELSEVIGGAWSATLLNSISRVVSTLYNIGYALGSSIKRVVTRKTCKL